MGSVFWMYDDTDIALIPANPQAVAAYVDGRWANYNLAKARFPGARLLSIAVFASDDAECLDVEPGDATNAQIYGWFKTQQARKQWRPCIYSSAYNIDAVAATMGANGFSRGSYRLWSAHYTGVAHVCGPASCGYTRTACDATQFTNHALARSLDETEALASFFGTMPGPTVKDVTVNVTLPVLQAGLSDPVNGKQSVHRLQGLLRGLGLAWGNSTMSVSIDGDFGAATEAAVKELQHQWGITQDGIVGEQTWGALIQG